MKKLLIVSGSLMMAFAMHDTLASVSPDPSDATVLVANVSEGQTETYADLIASSLLRERMLGMPPYFI